MDIFEFIAELVGHLAWPVALVIGLFIIRKHLGELVGNVSNITKALTGLKIGKFEASLGAIQTPHLPRAIKQSSVGSPKTKITDKKQRLIDLTEYSPRVAILDAFDELDGLLVKLSALYKNPEDKFVPSVFSVRKLEEKGILDATTARGISKLRSLRNEVRHDRDGAVPSDTALMFIELCFKYIDFLEFKIIEFQSSKKG
jgi:hypothetical protein